MITPLNISPQDLRELAASQGIADWIKSATSEDLTHTGRGFDSLATQIKTELMMRKWREEEAK